MPVLVRCAASQLPQCWAVCVAATGVPGDGDGPAGAVDEAVGVGVAVFVGVLVAVGLATVGDRVGVRVGVVVGVGVRSWAVAEAAGTVAVGEGDGVPPLSPRRERA